MRSGEYDIKMNVVFMNFISCYLNSRETKFEPISLCGAPDKHLTEIVYYMRVINIFTYFHYKLIVSSLH